MEDRAPKAAKTVPSAPATQARAPVAPPRLPSPGYSPGRSHLHGQYAARLRSPLISSTNLSAYGRSTPGSAGSRDTPQSSAASHKTPPRHYSDRYIPSRSGSRLDGFSDDPRSGSAAGLSSAGTPSSGGGAGTGGGAGAGAAGNAGNVGGAGAGDTGSAEDRREGGATHSLLLRNELVGADLAPRLPPPVSSGGGGSASGGGGGGGAGGGPAGAAASSPSRNLFKFQSPPRSRATPHDVVKRFSLSPLGAASERLLSGPRKAKRKVTKVPYKVLDAPALQDDFYLNLVDWSASNVLAVGLGSSVYLWSAHTSKVTRLVDVGPDDSVTSVAWTQRGTHLSVGTNLGTVQIWDAQKLSKVRTMGGHSMRVGTMAWNNHTLASGGRDRLIYLRDVRAAPHFTAALEGHKQEVCGLKWSFDNAMLASGGNDNKLLLWDAAAPESPVLKFSEHQAAVKAIAWSPHQHGLLASGGGTADRCIRFWNATTGAPLQAVDTGSQVCNLMWSKSINEMVSTHGYSLNQIIVWKYPSMTKVATLTGHTYRVLYLAMSPDGQTVVTGAGDETLRFWHVFPGPKSKASRGTSLLFPSGLDVR